MNPGVGTPFCVLKCPKSHRCFSFRTLVRLLNFASFLCSLALMKVELNHAIAHIVSETSTLRHLPLGACPLKQDCWRDQKSGERSKPVHSFILLRKLLFIATHVAIASPAPHRTPMAMCHEQRSLQGVVIPPVTGLYPYCLFYDSHMSVHVTRLTSGFYIQYALVISSWWVECPCDGYRTPPKSIRSQC